MLHQSSYDWNETAQSLKQISFSFKWRWHPVTNDCLITNPYCDLQTRYSHKVCRTSVKCFCGNIRALSHTLNTAAHIAVSIPRIVAPMSVCFHTIYSRFYCWLQLWTNILKVAYFPWSWDDSFNPRWFVDPSDHVTRANLHICGVEPLLYEIIITIIVVVPMQAYFGF